LALTLTIGSGPIALVQNGAIQETVFSTAGSNPIPATLPVASTAGNCLVAFFATGAANAVPVNLTMPTGWLDIGPAMDTTFNAFIDVQIYPNNPGGILSILPSLGVGAAGARWWSHMSEWSGVTSDTSQDVNGRPNAVDNTDAGVPIGQRAVDSEVAGTTTAPSDLPGQHLLIFQSSGDLFLAAWVQQIGASAAVTFTSPPGFTRLADNSSLARTSHLSIDYQLNPRAGVPHNPRLTSNTTTVSSAALWFALKRGTPTTDVTPFLAY
jgi:hypothetical protein